MEDAPTRVRCGGLVAAWCYRTYIKVEIVSFHLCWLSKRVKDPRNALGCWLGGDFRLVPLPSLLKGIGAWSQQHPSVCVCVFFGDSSHGLSLPVGALGLSGLLRLLASSIQVL